LPTSRWGSVRTSNIQIVQPAAPASMAYTWRLGEFGGCNVLCGGGIQLRPVACMDSYHNPVDFSMCPSPQPADSRYAVPQSLRACVLAVRRPYVCKLHLGGVNTTKHSSCKQGCTFEGCMKLPSSLLSTQARAAKL
jgi:hypothetical protein